MMENKYRSMIVKLLILLMGIFLAIMLFGCNDSIVADMNLDPSIAKALFIYGRVAGLSAHYFEEIMSQPRMRRINFDQAIYKGKEERKIK